MFVHNCSDIDLPWQKDANGMWVAYYPNGELMATLSPRLHPMMDMLYELYKLDKTSEKNNS